MAGLMREFIQESREQELSINTIHYKEIVDTGTDGKMMILSDSILLKYREDLNKIAYSKTLATEEMRRYHYKPHLLSYDLYGTPDFWFLLLDLNDLSSFTEFDLNPIKIYDGNLPTLIGKILNLEKESIDINAEEIKS